MLLIGACLMSNFFEKNETTPHQTKPKLSDYIDNSNVKR